MAVVFCTFTSTVESFSRQIAAFTDCNVGRKVSLFQDRENALTLDSVVQLQEKGRFKPSDEQIINLANFQVGILAALGLYRSQRPKAVPSTGRGEH